MSVSVSMCVCACVRACACVQPCMRVCARPSVCLPLLACVRLCLCGHTWYGHVVRFDSETKRAQCCLDLSENLMRIRLDGGGGVASGRVFEVPFVQ